MWAGASEGKERISGEGDRQGQVTDDAGSSGWNQAALGYGAPGVQQGSASHVARREQLVTSLRSMPRAR